jgi:hypothetical protein
MELKGNWERFRKLLSVVLWSVWRFLVHSDSTGDNRNALDIQTPLNSQSLAAPQPPHRIDTASTPFLAYFGLSVLNGFSIMSIITSYFLQKHLHRQCTCLSRSLTRSSRALHRPTRPCCQQSDCHRRPTPAVLRHMLTTIHT